VRHEGTVEVRRRIREEADGNIADCPDPSGRIADLAAKNAEKEFVFVLFVVNHYP
jgi:hypothetical protein